MDPGPLGCLKQGEIDCWENIKEGPVYDLEVDVGPAGTKTYLRDRIYLSFRATDQTKAEEHGEQQRRKMARVYFLSAKRERQKGGLRSVDLSCSWIGLMQKYEQMNEQKTKGGRWLVDPGNI